MIPPALIGRRVLAVFAHPDDESLACGGTLASLAQQGMHVVVMSASHGERGAHTGPARDDMLGRQRARELRAAAEVLGVAELIIGDHPDGDLQWAHVSELYAELVVFMRRHAPAAVITFDIDGMYWHRDHVGIHERTTSAVGALGDDAPPLYYVTVAKGMMTELVRAARERGWAPPAKGFWSLTPEAFGLHAEPPTISVDVSACVPRKLEAILCHATQMMEGHPLGNLEAGVARRLLGTEYFRRADIPTKRPPVLEQL
jgi:LmbE family N-acetylglucosaminyl deacetylase